MSEDRKSFLAEAYKTLGDTTAMQTFSMKEVVAVVDQTKEEDKPVVSAVNNEDCDKASSAKGLKTKKTRLAVIISSTVIVVVACAIAFAVYLIKK